VHPAQCLPQHHPSPALRAPSPLLRGGERDGVRGSRPIPRASIANCGPWDQRPLQFFVPHQNSTHNRHV
jgi:hypothetical protein